MKDMSRESKALAVPSVPPLAVSGLWRTAWRVILAQFLLAIWCVRKHGVHERVAID